jgi:RNase P subunit RPR2
MLAEEVAQNYPRVLKDLDKDLQANLKQKVCQNCNESLKKQNIDYLLTSEGRVIWWCRVCVKIKRRW